MSTETAQPVDLNRAADGLIQALEATTDLPGLRAGFANSIEFWSAFADTGNADHRAAIELVVVWTRLEALAAAVQTRKEQA